MKEFIKGLAIWFFPRILFKYDERNPYRRFCRVCGQQQDMYGLNVDPPSGARWWADMQKINDKNCECHKHARSW